MSTELPTDALLFKFFASGVGGAGMCFGRKGEDFLLAVSALQPSIQCAFPVFVPLTVTAPQCSEVHVTG